MIKLMLEYQAKDEKSAEQIIEAIWGIRNDAMQQPGYITGETLVNTDDPCNVLVISSWHSLEQWRAWHESEEQVKFAQRLDRLLAKPYTARTYNYSLKREHRVWSTF